MKITVGNVYSKVIQCTADENALLAKILCVAQPGHQFMPSFRSGAWDGMKTFYTLVAKTFPTGFLPFIIEQAHSKKYKVETVDERDVPGLQDPSRITQLYPKLREYQSTALTQVLTHSIRSDTQTLSWQRGVIKAPTGSGKTLLAASLIDFIHKKTLYVVERKTLLHQTYKAFASDTKMSLGLLGDGHEDVTADVTFAMAQTVRSKLSELTPFLKNIECLFYDECQHMAKGIYHQIAIKCPASFRYGTSATPLKRGDLGDAYLIADTGEIIAEGDREAIEAAGYLAKPTIFMFDVLEPQVGRMGYQHAYQACIVENEYRNEMIVQATQKLRQQGCTVLILVRLLKHGIILQRRLKSAGLHSVYINGKDSTEKQKQALKGIGKDFSILIASTILDEGIDCPILDSLICAGGGKSEIKAIQRVGRTLRPKEGNNHVYVVDFNDRTQRHLVQHSAARLAAYRTEGFDVKFPKYL